MKWISTIDLTHWADSRDCQENLPYLISRLIRATSRSIETLSFPSGENVLLGGYDGILVASEEKQFIPYGRSVWELGSGKDPKGKADSDYDKRSKNPGRVDPKDSIFVFVTPRIWIKNDIWVTEKRKEKIWKDVRVITSVEMEEWIELAPAVGLWLSEKIGKYPKSGIQTSDDFWEEWSHGEKYKIIPELLLGGRNIQKIQIHEAIHKPILLPIQSLSKDESLAFIISCFIGDEKYEEDFLARSLIVNTPDAYRELLSSQLTLILIPRFDDPDIIYRAVNKGHCVIVPLGSDASKNWRNLVVLPRITRNLFLSSLEKMGIKKELAEKYSMESGRIITILRRQLGFSKKIPYWAKPEQFFELLPSFIVGRWDENSEKDRELLSKIADESYENYIKKISKWLKNSDPPIIKIGSQWRWISPFDAWINASNNLTKFDFSNLNKIAKEVLCKVKSSLMVDPLKIPNLGATGREPEYSHMLRKGILQSLILTSLLGEKLSLNLPIKADLWVDYVIRELINTSDPLLWKSIDNELPLFAEASPSVFLDTIETSIKNMDSPVYKLFEAVQNTYDTTNYHTGLLWALESLAWMEPYFARAVLVLSTLAKNAPEVNISNKPINSLSEIFKPWHPQTLASLEDRIQVLKLISDREKEIAWNIMCGMIPISEQDTAFPTHKMRWRIFDEETENLMTYSDIFKTHSYVIEILVSIFDFTEVKFSQLIEISTRSHNNDKELLLTFIETNSSKVDHKDNLAWNRIREILYRHRSYPETNWSLPVADLQRLEELYFRLKPKDIISQIRWLFDDYWPKLIVGSNLNRISRAEHEKVIEEQRISATLNLYKKYGIKGLINLSKIVKEPLFLGLITGVVIKDEDEILTLYKDLYFEKDDLRFLYGVTTKKSQVSGYEWTFNIYKKLNAQGLDNRSLAHLFIPLNQTIELWEFIEKTQKDTKEEYWLKMSPRFGKDSLKLINVGIENILEFKRLNSAIEICYLYGDELDTNILIDVLKRWVTEDFSEFNHLQGYEINKIFSTLDSRTEIERSKFIELEWLYLPILGAYGNSRSPKLLHEELASNPDFFIDVLKWSYKSDSEELNEKEYKNLSKEQIESRGLQSYRLLSSWEKIPGVNEKYEIDVDFLLNWIEIARKNGDSIGRLQIVDFIIGKLFAQYPEKDEFWPPDPICEIIEKINSKDLLSNFSTGIFNKHGSSMRSPFEGGIIEREKVDYFKKQGEHHINKFPSVAKVLFDLAKGYEQQAKNEDDEAKNRDLDH